MSAEGIDIRPYEYRVKPYRGKGPCEKCGGAVTPGLPPTCINCGWYRNDPYPIISKEPTFQFPSPEDVAADIASMVNAEREAEEEEAEDWERRRSCIDMANLGINQRVIADTLGVSKRTVQRWLRESRRSG